MDRTYVSIPDRSSAHTPIVVMALHLFGVDAFLRRAADRFAAAGMATIVPDLYSELDAPDGDVVADPAQFIPLARSLESEEIDARFDAALQRMRERFPSGKVAIAGFCMGGVMATYRAANTRERYNVAAAWYGLSNDITPEQVTIPIVASYGAADHGLPVERVRAFYDALTVPKEVEIYAGAGHAFCDETRPSYRPEASDASWLRTLAFLQTHLQ